MVVLRDVSENGDRSMTARFANRIVVITGAGGGLGRALAIGFAREGAQLVLTDVDEALLSGTATILREQGTTCSTHLVDLASESEIQKFGAQMCKAHPRIDVLYNNAGLAYGEITTGFATLTQEKWLRYFAINSIAPLILAQALRPSLASAKGVILNQSSMAANMPATAYGITKSTLNAMNYGMAQTFGAEGIRVNAIAPGIMETPANKTHLSAEQYARIQGMQALKLHGTAEDIVALGLFLASDDARFITCEVVSCDAGNRMRAFRG
jgi:3-oxoacyl-[acyl-carrier protein] reductase